MWALYKRTFIPTQLLVIAVLLALRYIWNVDPKVMGVFVFVMEISAVYGTAGGIPPDEQGRCRSNAPPS